MKLIHKLRTKPRVNTVWTGDFSNLSPSDFGSPDFPGRFHPEIVAQGILRYLPKETRHNALVWDPMAGGGTTGDVCKMFGVPCVMSDAVPYREDISVFDVTDCPDKYWDGALRELGIHKEGVDLVIYHPPYWKAVAYLTMMDCASTLQEFNRRFQDFITLTSWAVKPKGYAVLVIGYYYTEGELHPLPMYCLHAMQAQGWKIKGAICKDFGETKGGHLGKNRALMRSRALKHGFWEYGWEHVFYLQRR